MTDGRILKIFSGDLEKYSGNYYFGSFRHAAVRFYKKVPTEVS